MNNPPPNPNPNQNNRPTGNPTASSTSHAPSSSKSKSSTSTSRTRPPNCAVCKHRKQKCGLNCPLAPYFPANKMKEFLNVHRLYGVQNMIKILKDMQKELWADIIDSIKFESNARAADPAGGSARIVQQLYDSLIICQQELALVQQNLDLAKNQVGYERKFSLGLRVPQSHDQGTSTSMASTFAFGNPDQMERVFEPDENQFGGLMQFDLGIPESEPDHQGTSSMAFGNPETELLGGKNNSQSFEGMQFGLGIPLPEADDQLVNMYNDQASMASTFPSGNPYDQTGFVVGSSDHHDNGGQLADLLLQSYQSSLYEQMEQQAKNHDFEKMQLGLGIPVGEPDNQPVKIYNETSMAPPFSFWNPETGSGTVYDHNVNQEVIPGGGQVAGHDWWLPNQSRENEVQNDEDASKEASALDVQPLNEVIPSGEINADLWWQSNQSRANDVQNAEDAPTQLSP